MSSANKKSWAVFVMKHALKNYYSFDCVKHAK